jgi:hypothetical protein
MSFAEHHIGIETYATYPKHPTEEANVHRTVFEPNDLGDDSEDGNVNACTSYACDGTAEY